MRKIPKLSFQQSALVGALLCVSADLVGPETASAQMTATVQEFGGRIVGALLSGLNGQPISREECVNNTPIPIQLTGVPFSMAQSRFISVWRGTPMSGACNRAMNRRPMGASMPVCTFVDSFPIDNTQMLINLGAGRAFGGSCDTQNSEEFWLLAVPAAEDNSTEVPSGDFTFVSIPIEVDPTPSDPPSNLQGGKGDSQIEISWTNPTNANDMRSAYVYVDTMGCNEANEVIAGRALVAGEEAPRDIPPETFGAVRTARLDGEALGLEINQYAAVAVTLVDRANNESRLSNVVCIQRVEVRGFWDAYCASRPGADGGLSPEACRQTYGCAVQPGARGTNAGWALVLGVMVVTMARRKKGWRAR